DYVADQLADMIRGDSTATATATKRNDGSFDLTDKAGGVYDTFTVTASELGGSIQALFDIDHGTVVTDPFLGVPTRWTYLKLIGPVTKDSNGNIIGTPAVLAESSGSPFTTPDAGSTSLKDPFIDTTLSAAGTYQIIVGSTTPVGVKEPLTLGMSYQLN